MWQRIGLPAQTKWYTWAKLLRKNLSLAGLRNVPNMLSACAEHVWEMSTICLSHVWSMSNTCGSTRKNKAAEVYPMGFLGVPWVCPEAGVHSVASQGSESRPQTLRPRLNLRATFLMILPSNKHSMSQSFWVETRSAMKQSMCKLRTLGLDHASL